MASKKKDPQPIVADSFQQLYLQELYNRTELERQIAMLRVRGALDVPEGMAYNPQDGTFLVPPAAPVPVELRPDDS
jgi:hypothetical protein